MARPLVVVVWLLLVPCGIASAGTRTSKVTIETDPPGAKVYLGLKEDGEKCTTPCTIDAPVGETAIIIEAENRRPVIENLVVRRSARPIKVVFKLEPAVGTLIVEGGDGATIRLDEEDVGTAPGQLDVVAGAHHVALIKNGKEIFSDFVDVEAGAEATIAAPAVAEPAAPDVVVVTDDDAPASPGARPTPMIGVIAAMNVGFRQFTYSNNETVDTQYDDREVGHLLTGATVELWPTTLLGARSLPGLALRVRFEYGVTPQAVSIRNAGMAMAQTSLTTAWRSLELSLQHRWWVANAGTIEVGAGYVDDRFRFRGEPDEVDMVPDAAYQAIRIGGRGSLLVRSFEPYVALENRIVLHGGAMEDRYALGTSVFGVRGALGTALHLGRFQVRLEGDVTLYRWAFRYYSSDPKRADGGSDTIEKLTLAVGYWY
jgi:hypothetical protein